MTDMDMPIRCSSLTLKCEECHNIPHYVLLTVCIHIHHVTSFSDGLATRSDPLCSLSGEMRVGPPGISRGRSQNENSFDLLLREAQAKLHKRKA
jgi:hypothetical protein